MALDGPGIIVSDLAADLYNQFRDEFDRGADQEALECWAEARLEARTWEHLTRMGG